MSFGSRIKEARKNKHLTQEQLGEMIGVAKSTVTGYEKGTSHPDEGKIISLMSVLNVDANYLWQDDIPAHSHVRRSLSPAELAHIKKYRDLDDHGKKSVDYILNNETERCKAQGTGGYASASSGAIPLPFAAQGGGITVSYLTPEQDRQVDLAADELERRLKGQD